MKGRRYHDARAEGQREEAGGVLRWSVAVLAAIVVFGLVFALLPNRAGAQDRTGVQLRGVSLRLYPAQDQDAEWRFTAPELSFDPVKEEATITGLQRGERWARDPRTRRLGLDLTLGTRQLTIDASDNIRTREADVFLIQGCYSLALKSIEGQPVLIDQNRGISAPVADIRSPAVNGGYENLQMSFDLRSFSATQRENFTVNSAPDFECVNGRTVPKPRR